MKTDKVHVSKNDFLKCYGLGALGVIIAQGFLNAFIYYGDGEALGYPLFWGVAITTMIIAFALAGKMP